MVYSMIGFCHSYSHGVSGTSLVKSLHDLFEVHLLKISISRTRAVVGKLVPHRKLIVVHVPVEAMCGGAD